MIHVLLCHQPHVLALGKLLTDWLGREGDMSVSDDCTLSEAPSAAAQREWDVIVLVVGYPDGDDQTHLAKLCELYPAARVIAVSLGATLPDYERPLREAGVDVVVAADDVVGLPEQIRELVGSK